MVSVTQCPSPSIFSVCVTFFVCLKLTEKNWHLWVMVGQWSKVEGEELYISCSMVNTLSDTADSLKFITDYSCNGSG